MRPSKTEATSPDSEPLTFRKEGGTLLVTNNSEEDSYLIFATTFGDLEPKAILFKAGTVEIDLKDVVNVTSFRVVGASKYDLVEERQKPCNLALCPIPPEPPIFAAFMVTPGERPVERADRRGRIAR